MRNIIVIGASAGGIGAVKKMVMGLSADLDAAFVVVLHLSTKSNAQNIADILQKQTSLRCLVARDNMLIESGNMYLAPQDNHLMVKAGLLKVNQGPHENKYRPSIDVLFRSAAVSYGNRTIGIILTGMLEDGTSGMWAVKSCGGICIVQDPVEAEYPDMPQSVINKVQADYRVYLDAIPVIIKKIVANALPPSVPVPSGLKVEAEITEQMMSHIEQLEQIADHSNFVCPDCGGGLWAIKNDPTHRYRCHTGHVYTEKLLAELQDAKIEESVWVSIRMLEEKSNMSLLMKERNSDDPVRAQYYQNRINDIDAHVNRLKKLLILMHNDFNDPANETSFG